MLGNISGKEVPKMDEQRKVLSLKEAYVFGVQHNLEQELAEIREMEIEWDLSYSSSLRRGYVIDLFTRKGVFDIFKEQYWPTGITWLSIPQLMGYSTRP
jgi:hypothetical protein